MSEEAEIQGLFDQLIEQLEDAKLRLEELERRYQKLLKRAIATAIEVMR